MTDYVEREDYYVWLKEHEEEKAKKEALDEYAEYLALPIGGIIQSPGRFEGESRYIPELWNLAMNGDGKEALDQKIEVFINSDDRSRYPELENVSVVSLWIDDNGFVYSHIE